MSPRKLRRRRRGRGWILGLLLSSLSVWAAAPTVETTNTSTQVLSGTHTVALPAGIVAGDLLLCLFNADNGAGSVLGITWPANWNLCAEEDWGAAFANTKVSVRYKIATGGEGASITVTTDNNEISAHNCYRISGYTGVPVCSGFAEHADDVDFNSPVLDPAGAAVDTLWLTAAGSNDGTSCVVSACPANYLTLLSAQGGSTNTGASMFSCRRALNATSEDPGVWTVGLCQEPMSVTIAVLSAAATGARPQAINMLLKLVR